VVSKIAAVAASVEDRAMRIALIAIGVAAFLAVDGFVLWAFISGRRPSAGPRGASFFVRACQVLGGVLIVAGAATIVARLGGVISDHWLAGHWTCSDGSDFEHRACNPGEAVRAVWILAGGAIVLGWLGTMAPAMRATASSSTA
jgi:hypothetical protein